MTEEALPAHETAAVLRMFRTGFTVPQIMRTLGISRKQLEHELNTAIDDEAEAHRLGQEIYDGLDVIGEGKKIPVEDLEKKRGNAVYVRAKFVKAGDEISHVGIVQYVRQLNTNDFVFKLESGEEVTYRPLDELLVRRIG